MGFRDYYRQFDDFDEFELNRERRERRQREKRLALEQLPELDLSGTEWPDMPHSEIANAAIARARGLVNRYPDRHATAVRRLLAERHEIDPERIVMGNGAAELLQSAVLFLLGRGDEMLMPWPSYPLYPLLATHAGAQPLACDRGAVLDSITEHTRAVVICNPNDPTGEYLPSHALGALLSALPDEVYVLLDEALVDFQDAEDTDACLHLVEAFPRLLVVRTFSKAWGLSGLRAGYAVGSDAGLLAAVAPNLGVNALTQAAIEHALRTGWHEIERRRAVVCPRARAPHRRAARTGRRRQRLSSELRLDARAGTERRPARPGAAQAGRDRGPGRPAWSRRPRARGRARRAGDAAVVAGC